MNTVRFQVSFECLLSGHLKERYFLVDRELGRRLEVLSFRHPLLVVEFLCFRLRSDPTSDSCSSICSNRLAESLSHGVLPFRSPVKILPKLHLLLLLFPGCFFVVDNLPEVYLLVRLYQNIELQHLIDVRERLSAGVAKVAGCFQTERESVVFEQSDEQSDQSGVGIGSRENFLRDGAKESPGSTFVQVRGRNLLQVLFGQSGPQLLQVPFPEVRLQTRCHKRGACDPETLPYFFPVDVNHWRNCFI